MDSNLKQHPLTLRRLRQDGWTRQLVREFRPDPLKMIQPLFVVEGLRSRESVPGLTDVYRDTAESIFTQIEADMEAGVHKFLLFGVPSNKTEQPSFDFTAEIISKLKSSFGRQLWLATDICVCSHTPHGHCGILNAERSHVSNAETVDVLAQSALMCAQAGADCVAPSDMMDGRISAIRTMLDKNGQEQTLLMSYSAKFHSKFYGPFRAAADSAPKQSLLQDRSTYQIDPGCPQDAWISSVRDHAEGADILMVKPGLPYLDVLYRLSQEIQKPWAVYEVSGEYAAIEVLAREGLIQAPQAHMEAWTAFFRAGAQMVISYGTRKAGGWIREHATI